jgi:hypothetical protein
MWLPPQGLRHAVDLLLKNGVRASKPPQQLADALVALADDMKAPPEAAEWIAAEFARLFGPGATADELLKRAGQRRPPVEPRDLFLIYVPEDRLTVAGPLAVELSKRRVTVAFSQYEVDRRDDLLAGIAHGLAHHRAGAVLFTAEFARKPWSQEPLDSRLLVLRDLARPSAVAGQLAARLLRPGP